MPRSFCYLINPAAGGGRALKKWNAIEPELRRRGLQGRVLLSDGPGSAIAQARMASSEFDLIVAVGGDGWVGEVAHGLRLSGSSTTALGILPLGSGNDAARMAGITDIEAALLALDEGLPRVFDTFEVSCQQGSETSKRTGLILVGFGLAADLILHAPQTAKRWLGGRVAYMAGFFSALLRHRPSRMIVRCDGSETEDDFAAVIVANHTHAGGHTMQIAPGALPDDGWLEVSRILGLGRLAVGAQFGRLRQGTHIRHPAVSYSRAREIYVTTKEPIPVQVDGEIAGTTPAIVRVNPASLKIRIPPGR